MIKITTLISKHIPILFILGWTMPVLSMELLNNDISEFEASEIFNINASSGTQLFKSGLYWNPQRQGWGINITQVSQSNGVNQLVAIIYTYRVDGSPIWYLASAPINGFSWTATLQEFFWNSSSAIPKEVGTIRLDFNALDKAVMSYTINGDSSSEPIQFFEFDKGVPSNELTALWFPPSEPGRGLTVSTIGSTSVAVLYYYDENGNPLWIIGSIAQSIALSNETIFPFDLFTGYCLACTTVNTNGSQAGSLKLTFNSRSSARLQTDNIAGYQADNEIVPLSDVLSTNKPPTTTNNTEVLNDTGITYAANNSVVFKDCTGPTIQEQDCTNGRDAKALSGKLNKVGYGYAGYDFTKIDVQGNTLAENAVNWSCVRDNHTGLVWEVKTLNDGPHSFLNTYRWGGLTALGDGTWGEYFDDWSELVNSSNNEQLCGRTNWRVPTRMEFVNIDTYYGLSSSLSDVTFKLLSLTFDLGHKNESAESIFRWYGSSANGVWTSSPSAVHEDYAWTDQEILLRSHYLNVILVNSQQP